MKSVSPWKSWNHIPHPPAPRPGCAHITPHASAWNSISHGFFPPKDAHGRKSPELVKLNYFHFRSSRTIRPRCGGKFADENYKFSARPCDLQCGRTAKAALLQSDPGQAAPAEVPQCAGTTENLLSQAGGPGARPASHRENVRLQHPLLSGEDWEHWPVIPSYLSGDQTLPPLPSPHHHRPKLENELSRNC